ncbi:YfcE family phosphodiesterase [Sporanaerobium hydrogeniformans]|uniref:YfcE family phosphodiesterase n=1 Tax=Sporanaerobium hydrogeniformans TaxID=3072179 RepID=A0AC61DFH4_9FIRM|nr:phosphodiesterase [Sporanaerobium hydrogeniformans]PHV71682.1 YfcE family phosphodiesterase [Sporanaerobium hydrogeniformans]
MKYMILSDIHGSETCLQKALSHFEDGHFDFLILLGDILYHGPRNPLPEGHNPSGVVTRLNAYAKQIFACRGNCEAEVDQMLLNFPCLSDYTFIVDEGIRLFATHGHLYNPQELPPLEGTALFLYGHTHLWEIRKEKDICICNPGSLSLPKEGRPATYGVYENHTISIYTLDGKLLASETF